MIAIHANGIPHIFPDAVLAEAEKAEPSPANGKLPHEDWRELPLVTIDPADAKDHDDAVYARARPGRTPGGVHRHRRDRRCQLVCAARHGARSRGAEARQFGLFPRPRRADAARANLQRSLLAARRRGPPCPCGAHVVRRRRAQVEHSLPPHHDAQRTPSSSYPAAQAAIDGKAEDKTAPMLDTILKPALGGLCSAEARPRVRAGRWNSTCPSARSCSKPDGTVDRVVVPERLDAHKLIEEFMIQANVAAAETLERKQAGAGLPHPRRALDGQAGIAARIPQVAQHLAGACGETAAVAVQRASWSRCRGSDREELVNEVVLRSQSQAEYAPANIGHFGLNLLRYAHFTSPIRRYADLIVHRALVTALKLGEGGISPEQEAMLEVIATDISAAERRAMQAERETIDRLVAGFLERKDRRGLQGTHQRRHQGGAVCHAGGHWCGRIRSHIYDRRRVLPVRSGPALGNGRGDRANLPDGPESRGAACGGGTDSGCAAFRDHRAAALQAADRLRSRPANQKRGTRARPGGGFPAKPRPAAVK